MMKVLSDWFKTHESALSNARALSTKKSKMSLPTSSMLKPNNTLEVEPNSKKLGSAFKPATLSIVEQLPTLHKELL